MQAEDRTRERRRSPRVEGPASAECLLEVRTRVRLVDISLTGTLMAAEVLLPIGTRAHLRSNLGVSSFTPAVQVRRVADAPARGTGRVGAMFTTMDDRSRRSLEEFLRKATL
jgi:c-di-GMP-binding flagellar brake protein YcgR